MAATVTKSPEAHSLQQQTYLLSNQRPSPYPRPSPSPGIGQDNGGSRDLISRPAYLRLPPQRRAEVLLEEMAGLAGKAMELANENLRESQSMMSYAEVAPKKVTGQQFLNKAVVPPQGSSATSAREVLELLRVHQGLLSETIFEVQQLKEVDMQREQLVQHVHGADTTLRQFAKRLREAQHQLETTLDEYQEYMPLKRRLKVKSGQTKKESAEAEFGEKVREPGLRADCDKGTESETVDPELRGEEYGGSDGIASVDVKDLVAFAHKISYTTFAPPEFAQGGPLLAALPPAPQDEQMRASALYQVSESDLGISRPIAPPTQPEAGPTIPANQALPTVKQEPAAATPPMPSAANGVAPAGIHPSLPLPSTTIPAPPLVDLKTGTALPMPLPPPPPPGWKPGDPIPLPSELAALPLPPPGWKPGDPILLPPGVAAPGLPPVVELPARAANVPTPSVARPPGVSAQVPPSLPGQPPAATFQVQHVELDLNPELEDSDSYFSDSSSDDED